jgi:hypothetical protein
VVDGYDFLPRPGNIDSLVYKSTTTFFAYSDLNRDLTFQATEPGGWYNNGEPADLANFGDRPLDIVIVPAAQARIAPPDYLIDRPIYNLSKIENISVGSVTTLDESIFSQEEAESGLWQPYAFIVKGNAGIYFLEDYDPERIPVLFVHGINGTPRSFTPLIESLDKSRYQPWVFYYPSGLPLPLLSSGLFNLMQNLQVLYQFNEAHLIAHSMGGLVSRGYLNECINDKACNYLTSFTTIATPWGGAASADLGIKYAPTVVPVWNDLSPSSAFLNDLFITETNSGLRVNLFFAFRRENLIGSENTDGAVSLSSQLRYDAQAQADKIMGFDKSHVGVLSDPLLLDAVNTILNSE